MSKKIQSILTKTVSLLAVGAMISCSESTWIEQNKKLKKELEASQRRLNAMELYVNDLQEQMHDKEAWLEEERLRIEDTYAALNTELLNEIEKDQIEIENIKGVLTINIAETLFFDSGSAEIKEEGKPILLRIGKLLKRLPEKHVRVEGHTDNVPIGEKIKEQYPTNWELAAIRAVEVVKFFIDEAEIDPARLAAISYSQYRPIRNNKTAKGRKKNRRIEIVVIDKQLYQVMETKKGLSLPESEDEP